MKQLSKHDEERLVMEQMVPAWLHDGIQFDEVRYGCHLSKDTKAMPVSLCIRKNLLTATIGYGDASCHSYSILLDSAARNSTHDIRVPSTVALSASYRQIGTVYKQLRWILVATESWWKLLAQLSC